MKKLILGILIGFILSFATNAFAAVGDRVEAVFAQFNYVVNGKSVTLDSPVLVQDGNSYLRTTQISNMLGYDVTYKADSRTIEFSGTLPAAEPTSDAATSPIPSSEPTASADPSTSPEPTQDPAKVAACQAIRDKWAVKIATYIGKNPKEQEYTQRLMATQRDQELATAGC